MTLSEIGGRLDEMTTRPDAERDVRQELTLYLLWLQTALRVLDALDRVLLDAMDGHLNPETDDEELF